MTQPPFATDAGSADTASADAGSAGGDAAGPAVAGAAAARAPGRPFRFSALETEEAERVNRRIAHGWDCVCCNV